MMVSVVPSERDSTRDAHRDVAEDSHDLVEGHIATSTEMSEIMYTTVKSMVQKPSDKVGISKNEPNRHILKYFIFLLQRGNNLSC